MMQTFWNGEPCECERIEVIIGPALKPTYWHAGLEGHRRKAVLVHYKSGDFLLDNEDGSGWAKVTEGHGSPRWSHRSLPDSSVRIVV